MGRGKTVNKSGSVYQDNRNKDVRNVKYVNREKKEVEDEALDMVCETEGVRETAKPVSLNYEYFKNSKKRVLLTRDPESICGKDARIKFYNMVKKYEEESKVQLCELSTNELAFRLLSYMEDKQAIISLKDNSKQFLPYKFAVPSIVELYLYKLFYSRIFDYDIIGNNDEIDIVFRSKFINENFDEIYQQIGKLIKCLWYDGLTIAIYEMCNESFGSINKEFTIDVEDDIEDLEKDIALVVQCSSDARVRLLEYYTLSIIFMAKFHMHLYKDQTDKDHKITSLLKGKTYYKRNRSFDSRVALGKAYDMCGDKLLENKKPFTRMLNIYFLNKKSNLFDFDIIAQNKDFPSYILDGIVSKYHINDMIISNSEKLNLKAKPDSKLSLPSIRNNPNCMVNNILSRDYEVLNYLIKAASNSARLYYLSKYGKDVSAQAILDLIDCIDICDYTKKMDEVIFPAEAIQINNVDYERVTEFLNINGEDVYL